MTLISSYHKSRIKVTEKRLKLQFRPFQKMLRYWITLLLWQFGRQGKDNSKHLGGSRLCGNM